MRPVVLYLGGTSRSGSTLLECLLARLDGVVVLGEVAHLWRRGLINGELCACGEPFARCPFWQQVGDHAFGGWSGVDVDRVLELKRSVDRQRRLHLTGRRNPPRAIAEAASEYAGYYRRIYEAAGAITGAAVVVDSSKVPPTAVTLTHDDAIDLRVLHIVRDSRGVAYSWTKTVSRPETATGEPMPRFGVGASATQWLAHNAEMGLARHRGAPLVRLRYEDLVDDAHLTVRTAWSDLALPGDGLLAMQDQHTVELRPTHSVAGNPMRFRHGTTRLQPDLAWRTELPRGQRRLVTAITLPLLRRYGYLGRGPQGIRT
jgi:hypothetical protein